MISPFDQLLLQRCNHLALLGGTAVQSNPLVGAVLVHEGRIIGEGFHQSWGGPHAEVNAIRSVKKTALLQQATLYVNLEPCNFFGKTPPCSHLIVEKKIPKVVIGCLDPNPKVSGKGVAYLREAGVEVIMADDYQPFVNLNRRFFVNQQLKRPYICLKWAQSPEGYLAGLDAEGNPYPVAITGFEAATLSHSLRARMQAILVGRNTALLDDPSLTNRLAPGKHPLRLVLDRKGRLPKALNLFSDGVAPTWRLTEGEEPGSTGAGGESTQSWNPWPADLPTLFQELYDQHQVHSILVEGGADVLKQCLEADLYDEIYVLRGETRIVDGLKAPELPPHLKPLHEGKLGRDRYWYFQENRAKALK
jgi:diaminohydroxyphosphoribosylaminopyrimidine deaminase/5-amino-6-(5-phosphoribosylamino)uracil reductase